MIDLVSRLELCLVAGEWYPSATYARTSPKDLFEPQLYPHVAYAYFEKDLSAITLSQINERPPKSGSFFTIDDLHVPEHLGLSVFLKDRTHAGFFSVSHHAQFLSTDSRRVTPPSAALVQKYRRLRSQIARTAARVCASKQTHYVLPNAARELTAGNVQTTFGASFDAQLVAGLKAATVRHCSH